MAVRINNQGSTHSVEEIVWICDLADLVKRELATQTVISVNWSYATQKWTIKLSVQGRNHSLDLDPMNHDPTDVDGFIAEIKLISD